MLPRFLRGVLLGCSFLATSTLAQTATPPAASDPFAALHFLEGTWTAHGTGQGAVSDGVYSFKRELGGHILARHSGGAACKGPESFDCEHGDLLYLYTDAPGQPLKAIYFDNEGHVIHYDVTTPDPASVMLLSDASTPGPRFRLLYSLKDGVMTGSFAMQPPGGTAWRTYLQWSGTRK